MDTVVRLAQALGISVAGSLWPAAKSRTLWSAVAKKEPRNPESLFGYVNALQSGKTPGRLNLQYFSGSFLQAVPEVQQALLETRCQKLGPYLLKVSDEGFAQVETYAKFIAECQSTKGMPQSRI